MRLSPFEHNYQKPPQQQIPVYQQNQNIVGQYYTRQFDAPIGQPIRQPPVTSIPP